MDLRTIIQDERRKKFIIIGSVVFLVIVGIIFLLTKTPSTPPTNNDQLLSDIAKLAPKDSLSQNANDRLNKLPAITLSADATAVAPGQTAVISWSSPNSVSCVDGNGNELLTTGSISVTPTETSTMDVVCTNPKGTSIESIAIGVTTAPIIALSAYPSSVKAGDQSFISWNTTNTTRCVDSAGKTLRLSDRFSVVVKAQYTFSMSCVGPKGESKNSVTITIAPPQTKIVATKTTITTTPKTSTTVLTSATKTTRAVTTNGVTATTGAGKASIALTASSLTVKYGESSTISFATKNATMCTGTTPTGVEILSNTAGNASIILHPGDQFPAPPASLPVDGSIKIKVLDGQSTATLTIRCTDSAGNKTERSITVRGLPPAPDLCKTYGRPTFKLSPSAISVPAGGKSDVSWNATCATKCTADVVPWGELITYTDTSAITDYEVGQDYNKYISTRSLQNLAVNTTGGIRVYPGTPDGDPVLLTPTCVPSENNYCSTPPTPQSSTVTLKCINSSGDTPYSTTDSVTISIVPPGGSCSTVLCDIVDFVGGLGDAIGGLFDW